jgi:hypothetical protein
MLEIAFEEPHLKNLFEEKNILFCKKKIKSIFNDLKKVLK